METLLLSLCIGFIHAAAGTKLWNLTKLPTRIPACLASGGAVWLYSGVWQYGAIVAVGTYLWYLGYGLGGWTLAALSGSSPFLDANGKKKRLVKPFVYLCNKLSPYDNREWGVIYMGLYGLFMVPVFLAIAAFGGSHYIAALGVGCLLQGIPYFISGMFNRENPTAQDGIAKFLWGAWLGFLLSMATTI